MAADVGVIHRKITVSYPSHNGETPFGFIVHNKGFFGSYFLEYFLVNLGDYVTSHDSGSISCGSKSASPTSAFFICDTYKEFSVDDIEITPLYSDTFNVVSAEIITFKIQTTEYKALKGMTWGEWVESVYNTDGFYWDSSQIASRDGRYRVCLNDYTSVINSDEIIGGCQYLKGVSSAGGDQE